ncbi:MAG: AmmeMemoRadiSam system protein B, partial [Candidatus Hadarchaeum sp.]|uniref:AmmeMemoRadiSam system protein B n=1 Tax=Candidatus Hadarchaeum sp. TaxID=2883567 RepID=UPI003D0BDCE3
PVAAHLYRKLWSQETPATVVILGPNHTGYGAGLAVTTEDFMTPLGVVRIDDELVAKIVGDGIMNDYVAHAYEHSIEVQLPFMQYIGWESKIVPLCVGIHEYDELKEAGRRLGKAISGRDDVLVIASSDMSHYVPARTAKELDGKAINAILSLDSRKLYDTIFSNNITMC